MLCFVISTAIFIVVVYIIHIFKKNISLVPNIFFYMQCLVCRAMNRLGPSQVVYTTFSPGIHVYSFRSILVNKRTELNWTKKRFPRSELTLGHRVAKATSIRLRHHVYRCYKHKHHYKKKKKLLHHHCTRCGIQRWLVKYSDKAKDTIHSVSLLALEWSLEPQTSLLYTRPSSRQHAQCSFTAQRALPCLCLFVVIIYRHVGDWSMYITNVFFKINQLWVQRCPV